MKVYTLLLCLLALDVMLVGSAEKTGSLGIRRDMPKMMWPEPSLNIRLSRLPRELPKSQKTEVSPEEYAVYSAYLNGIEISPNDGKAVKLIVINDHTTIIESSCSQDNIAKYNQRIAKGELRPLFESSQARSKESVSLSRLFNIKHDYVLLAESAFADFFKAKDLDGWEDFYKKYPGSSGYISLSRVGFNTTFTKAIIFRKQNCGSLCGSGDHILFEKVDGKWKDIGRFNCWMS